MISLFRMDSVLGRSTGFAAWMDSAMERLPPSSCKGATLELRLGLSLPFFSGRASRTKGFLRRPKLLLLQPFQSILEISFGSKGSLPAPILGCKQPFGYEQLYRSLQSSWSSCCHEAVMSPSSTTLRVRSIGYISETWDLSSLFFCFWFYFKLLISCVICIYGNTYPSMLSVLRTFLWCWCQLVQTQPSPNSYSSGQKKAKGWPHPNHLLLPNCVNSWTALSTLTETA